MFALIVFFVLVIIPYAPIHLRQSPVPAYGIVVYSPVEPYHIITWQPVCSGIQLLVSVISILSEERLCRRPPHHTHLAARCCIVHSSPPPPPPVTPPPGGQFHHAQVLPPSSCLPRPEGNVWLDPDFVMEQVAQGPAPVRRARPATRPTTSPSAATTWCSGRSHGLLFVREGRRAPGGDDERLRSSSASCRSRSRCSTRPAARSASRTDAPLDSRHLDMVPRADDPDGQVLHGVGHLRVENAIDTLNMADIMFGGRENIERDPAMISLINVNSPLRYDERMLGAMFEYARARPAALLTPFLLMGAMSPPCRDAHPAGGRGAGRHRAGAADQAGRAGDLRLLPLEQRHAVGLPAFGTPESAVGRSAPARSPATTACRSARAAV